MSYLTDCLSPHNIMVEVTKFISGTTRHSQSLNTLDLTKIAITLLKNVPAAREAVLEYFCSIFFIAVTKHIRNMEMRQYTSIAEENIINEIYVILSNFINGNSQAWAPIISTWSLDLLGKLSSDYSKRMNLSADVLINDSLKQWMSCPAARKLVDITAQCLRYLMHSNTEYCIKALLDTSAVHNPHFDWVVAHVGSCFPNIVITRILLSGLRDFSIAGYSGCKDKKVNSKLNSVVEILSHLAVSHFYDIRAALLDLFMWSLDENSNNSEDTYVQRIATVPFLLNLASLSLILLKALTNDISQILRPHVIPTLFSFSLDWLKYFNNDTKILMNTTVHLALGCDQGAFQIINILLDTILDANILSYAINTTESLKTVSFEILELILQEIELKVRSDNIKSNYIPFLVSMKQDLSTLIPLLISCHPLKVRTAMRLISLLGIQNPNILISAATYILQKAETNFHSAVFVRLTIENPNIFSKLKNESITSQEYFNQIVEQALREVQYLKVSESLDIQRLFQNLTILLKWEKSGKVPNLKSKFITQAATMNLLQISIYLTKMHNFDFATDIVKMLNCLKPLSNNFSVNVELTLRLTRAIIYYFYMCICENDIIRKIRGVKVACHFLKSLTTYSSYARVLALREILEIAIFGDFAKYFGAKEKFKLNISDALLLQQNHKQGTGAILASRHLSVFHAGIVGLGPRKRSLDNAVDKDVIALNNTLLMDVIKACCHNRNLVQYPVDTDILTLVSLLLVELISPDVMYNGLPWPDEEFTRVTVERDLQIRRSFQDAPVIWILLQLTAWYRPALAYCSVLLRAVVATVVANWNTKIGIKITNVMALGQLLPPPLTSITDILSILEPHQISVVIRECVWMYMHENIPSPMLFTRAEGAGIAWRDSDSSTPNIRFTETLRLLLLANIHLLGSIYAILFYNKHKKDKLSFFSNEN